MDLQLIAAQLRKPYGELGKKVGLKMNEGNAFINLATIEQLHLHDNDNILEIGMGNGHFVQTILEKKPGIKYTGCDFSETMIAEAIQLNQSYVEAGRAAFVLASSDTLPFERDSFDTVFCVNTIYFWAEPLTELKEILRVLRKGGKIVIGLRPASIMKTLPFTQFGFTLYTKSEVEELLLTAGYTAVHITEQKEPDQGIDGHIIQMETLILCASKP